MFYVQRHRHNRENCRINKPNENFFMLTEDNWNDYGFETTFYLDYWLQGEYHEIGLIRILNKDDSKTRNVIPREFERLNKEFISIGYTTDLYLKLIKTVGKDKALTTLKKLNDISIVGLENNPYFNIDSEGIQNSFFRSSDGRIIYSDGYKTYFLEEESQDRDYSFEFSYFPTGNIKDESIDIGIDFLKNGILPNRLFTIIGKNGIGKTRLLNQLAESLFDSSKKGNKRRFHNINVGTNEVFKSEIPMYNKIIAISFSVFDNFYKGPVYSNEVEDESSISRSYEDANDEEKTKFNNYTYIGLHKFNGNTYSNSELIDINKRSYTKIIEKNREDIWLKSINGSNILNLKISPDDFDMDDFFQRKFSSGQSIFISMVTRLLAEIESGSLVFLDEPELYLHPNAIANLARIYFNILEFYKSYAILCTHSPILVQEMPSLYVRKFFEIDDTLYFIKPEIETFGANIADITAEIFNVQETESLYKTKLREWANEFEEELILQNFNNNLSLKTELYLTTLYKGRE